MTFSYICPFIFYQKHNKKELNLNHITWMFRWAYPFYSSFFMLPSAYHILFQADWNREQLFAWKSLGFLFYYVGRSVVFKNVTDLVSVETLIIKIYFILFAKGRTIIGMFKENYPGFGHVWRDSLRTKWHSVADTQGNTTSYNDFWSWILGNSHRHWIGIHRGNTNPVLVLCWYYDWYSPVDTTKIATILYNIY